MGILDPPTSHPAAGSGGGSPAGRATRPNCAPERAGRGRVDAAAGVFRVLRAGARCNMRMSTCAAMVGSFCVQRPPDFPERGLDRAGVLQIAGRSHGATSVFPNFSRPRSTLPGEHQRLPGRAGHPGIRLPVRHTPDSGGRPHRAAAAWGRRHGNALARCFRGLACKSGGSGGRGRASAGFRAACLAGGTACVSYVLVMPGSGRGRPR